MGSEMALPFLFWASQLPVTTPIILGLLKINEIRIISAIGWPFY